ncbi:Cyclic AMP-responsive element-binding protein 1 [Mactra antiquata]
MFVLGNHIHFVNVSYCSTLPKGLTYIFIHFRFSTKMSDSVTSDIDVNQSLSVVQVSLASPTLQVQSVIQPNQQIIQSSSQNSVIQTTGSNVPTIQVVRVAQVDEEQLSDNSEGRKRREILSRRPSYRKIFNDLSSPVSVAKIEEESNSSQSQDGDSQDGTGSGLSAAALQYQGATVLPSGAIQISVNADGTPVAQGLQTLTMTNASPASSAASTGGATIVQYAQGPDGQQFYIPVGNTGTMQAYQIATPGTLPQGVVMATNSTAISSRDAASEEAARKRELRLLKNREAAKECRRKKKDYVKCLENRVAVLENQNKTLIEELKALKELYCQTEV